MTLPSGRGGHGKGKNVRWTCFGLTRLLGCQVAHIVPTANMTGQTEGILMVTGRRANLPLSVDSYRRAEVFACLCRHKLQWEIGTRMLFGWRSSAIKGPLNDDSSCLEQINNCEWLHNTGVRLEKRAAGIRPCHVPYPLVVADSQKNRKDRRLLLLHEWQGRRGIMAKVTIFRWYPGIAPLLVNEWVSVIQPMPAIHSIHPPGSAEWNGKIRQGRTTNELLYHFWHTTHHRQPPPPLLIQHRPTDHRREARKRSFQRTAWLTIPLAPTCL